MKPLLPILQRKGALIFALTGAATLGPRTPAAHAQSSVSGLKFAAKNLVNRWDGRNGDRYVFRSNGTYTFTAGREKRKSGNISHSGTWELSQYRNGAEEGTAGTATLRLHAKRRIVLEGSRKKTLRSNSEFKLSYLITEADGVSLFNKVPFYTPDSPERSF